MAESRFRALSLNLRGESTAAQVAADVRKAASTSDLIGWQEVLHAHDRHAIRDLGNDGKWRSFFSWTAKGAAIPLPISWHTARWDEVSHGHRFMHGGLAGVSPARYATWVVLRNKVNGATIARVNTHLVNKAWGPWIPSRPWRRRMWRLHITRLADLCADLAAQGHIVILGGDFNRDSYKVMGDTWAYDINWRQNTCGVALYDYLMHAPRGGRLVHRDDAVGVVRGFNSDHDAQVAAYTLA